MLGSIVTANYITVTTDSKTSIHRAKGQNMFQSQPGNQSSLVPVGKYLKNKGDIDVWSLSDAYPPSGSEQTKVVSLPGPWEHLLLSAFIGN